MLNTRSNRRRILMDGAADPTPPTPEQIMSAFNAINTAFEEFRNKNDERIAELESGVDDVVRREELDRINNQMNEGSAELQELNRRLAATTAFPGGDDPNGFTAEDRQHRDEIVNYMRNGTEPEMASSVGSDPDGGYTVGREIEAGIDRVVGLFGAMRQLATVRTIGAASYRRFRGLGGSTSGWVGESESRPETNTPQLQRMEFPTHEIYAMPAATQTLLDDSEVNIEAWLADEVGIEFAEEEAQAHIKGTGDNQPRGLISGYDPVANASFDNANPRLGYIATGVSAGFPDGGSPSSAQSDPLIDLMFALNRRFRMNASWLMNDLTISEIRKFKDADGHYIWQPPLQADQPSMLLGKSVFTDDFMDDIAADSFSVAFGDFRRTYLIVDRVGVRVLRDPYTSKPNVLFYTTKRTGGGIQDFEACKLLKFGTS